ncbi:E3 ubiquitin-protein ligase Midline-1-like [Branchiostoma floridae x Branchiostoma belcheri]
MEGLEEELTCPVCLELFICPLQLPCNHNLCHRCVEVILQTGSESTRTHDQSDRQTAACSAPSAHVPGPEKETDSFLCPTCRMDVRLDARGLDGMKKNSLLQNIVERYKKMKSTSDHAVPEVPCQLCKPDRPKMAFRSCLDCRASYCEECLAMTHPEHPPFSEHKIVDPRTSFEEPSQVAMCPDHPSKPVEMYCVQDQTPVCLLCEKVGRHKQHNMAALEEGFSQRRAELQGGVDRMVAWLTQAEEGLRQQKERRKYLEQSAAKLKDAIEQECEALHEIIRQRAAEMNRLVSLFSEEDVERVQSEIDKLEDNMQQSRTAIAYAQEALKETDHGCFLQNVDFFMNKINILFDNFVDPDEIKCYVKYMKIDLSQKKEQLKAIDFGAPPKAPVILYDECRYTTDKVYIKWQLGNNTDEYYVEYDVNNVHMTATVKGDCFTAKCLAPGTTYTFVVRSRNKTGYSPSSRVQLVTKQAPTCQPQCQQKPFTFELCPFACSSGLQLLDDYTRVKVMCTGGHTVLGNRPVSYGKHYWEVKVKSRHYNIGVAYEAMPINSALSGTSSSWAFVNNNRYALVHNGQTYWEENFHPKPTWIGVLLDYDGGELSFYNAESNEHLITWFKMPSTEPLYPAFSLWSGELTIHTGLVCPY